MRIIRLTMEIRWFCQRYRLKLTLFVLLSLCLGIIYSVQNKLLYLETNLPFSARTMNVPYAAETSPKETKIPRIIHQTWKTNSVPQHFSTWMKSWQEKHPNYEYWFWTDNDVRRLIAKKYPNFLDLFDSYAFNIQRADVLRYFILFEFGGIYSDLDVEIMRPIESILKNSSCYLSQEPLEHAFFFWGMDRLACNAIMACRPKHPYFKHVLENLNYYKGISIAPLVRVAMPVMESSGPKMVTWNLDSFEKDGKYTDTTNTVRLWPAEFFFPDADLACMPYVKRKCRNVSYRRSFSKELEKVCAYHEKTEYTNQPHPNPYGNHHWSHTYYGLKKKATVPIRDVIKNVRFGADILDKRIGRSKNKGF